MRTFTPVKLIKYKMGWRFLGVTPKSSGRQPYKFKRKIKVQ